MADPGCPLHLLPTFTLADSTPVLLGREAPPEENAGRLRLARSETPTSVPYPGASPPTVPGTQHQGQPISPGGPFKLAPCPRTEFPLCLVMG